MQSKKLDSVKIKSDSTNKFSVTYVCLLSLQRSSYKQKISQKVFIKTSLVKVKLIQLSIVHACFIKYFNTIQIAMLVYEECFNTVQIYHACSRRIFQYGFVYLHVIYNNIYVCYIRLVKKAPV